MKIEKENYDNNNLEGGFQHQQGSALHPDPSTNDHNELYKGVSMYN